MLYILVLLAVAGSALLPSIKFKEQKYQKIADKIRPYYHIIGLCGFAAGIVFIVQVAFNIRLMGYGWFLWLALAANTLLLGFLAGFPMIMKHIAKEGKKQTEDVYKKFAPYEKVLAYVGIAICVLMLVHIMFAKPDIFTAVMIRRLVG